jgi:hypothetical protein
MQTLTMSNHICHRPKILLYLLVGLSFYTAARASVHIGARKPDVRFSSQCIALRGGQNLEIDEEYRPLIGDPDAIKSGVALGSVEREDITAKLPWPPGSEDKRNSLNEYQLSYRKSKDELLVHR